MRKLLILFFAVFSGCTSFVGPTPADIANIRNRRASGLEPFGCNHIISWRDKDEFPESVLLTKVRLAQQAGVQWDRDIHISWEEIDQYVKGDISVLNKHKFQYNLFKSHNIKCMVILLPYAPQEFWNAEIRSNMQKVWSGEMAADDLFSHAWRYTAGEDWNISWKNSCRKIAELFRGEVDYFQICNEPNNVPNWTPEVYARVLRLANQGLKEGNSSSKTVWGGLGRGATGTLSPISYLREFINIPGTSSSYDVLGLHLYGIQAKSTFDNAVSTVTDKEIWIDETGDVGSGFLHSNYLKWTYCTYLKNNRVTKIFWYAMCDYGMPQYNLLNFQIGSDGLPTFQPTASYNGYRDLVNATN